MSIMRPTNAVFRPELNAHAVIEKPLPYLPPTGFEKRSISDLSHASQLFSSSNLKNKQIWYITAPASVPISSVKKMTLRDAKNRKSVLTHNENDYGFVQDTSKDKEFIKIMVPNAKDNGYRAGK
jgi:hypothetical protein